MSDRRDDRTRGAPKPLDRLDGDVRPSESSARVQKLLVLGQSVDFGILVEPIDDRSRSLPDGCLDLHTPDAVTVAVTLHVTFATVPK